MTPMFPITIMVTNFSNHPVLVQKHVRVAVIAETPACVVYLLNTTIQLREKPETSLRPL